MRYADRDSVFSFHAWRRKFALWRSYRPTRHATSIHHEAFLPEISRSPSPPSDRCGTWPQWRDQHFCARATDFSLDSPLPHLPHRSLPFNAHIKQPEYLRIAGLLLNCSGWMMIVYPPFYNGSDRLTSASRISHTRVMVYKGHREISILVAPLFLPKKQYWWPQGGPYFKTSPYWVVMQYEAGLVFHSTVMHLNTNNM